MSADNATGSGADLTMVRRNPGTGLIGSWSCALCSKRHHQQAGLRKVRFGSSWTLMCKGNKWKVVKA